MMGKAGGRGGGGRRGGGWGGLNIRLFYDNIATVVLVKGSGKLRGTIFYLANFGATRHLINKDVLAGVVCTVRVYR